jgi:hypothetical protein
MPSGSESPPRGFIREGGSSHAASLSRGAPPAPNAPRIVAPPQDAKQYINALVKALSEGEDSEWKKLYEAELASFGDHCAASPSFFLNTARVLAKHDRACYAIRIATNCLETGIDDVQMLRSVGYVLLSLETSDGVDLSIEVFDRVRELEPSEPQSFIDSGLARFWKAWKEFSFVDSENLAASQVEGLRRDITAAQESLVHVLTHHWATRFDEVEWPALTLLHYVAELVENVNKSNLPLTLAEWPSELDAFKGNITTADTPIHPLRCPEFDPALMVWLGWDTDKTDVDLHVKEPSGKEVSYQHKRGTGSLLSKDFTRGYGPEVYIAKKDGATGGAYEVYAKYFSSHQDSASTGTTSAVVWTIETDNLDGRKHINFSFVRLDTHKQKTHVATVKVGAGSLSQILKKPKLSTP